MRTWGTVSTKNLALLDFSIAFLLTFQRRQPRSIASMRTLLQSSNATFLDRPVCSNVVDGVWWCATAIDRGRPQWMASVWTLLKYINAWFLIPSRSPCMNAVGGCRRRLNAVDDLWMCSNTCEGISEDATLISNRWPSCVYSVSSNIQLLNTAECFGTVSYYIMLQYFVQYHIISIVFPHAHIVPSLIAAYEVKGSLYSTHSACSDRSPMLQCCQQSKVKNSLMLQFLILIRHSDLTVTLKIMKTYWTAMKNFVLYVCTCTKFKQSVLGFRVMSVSRALNFWSTSHTDH